MFSHCELPPPLNGHVESALAQPWERQPAEGNKAFQAFELYRSMGHERSLSKVGRELGKSTQLLSRWSSRHEWQKRVAAWDAHEAQTINAEVLAGTAEMRRRQCQQALALQTRAQERVQNMSKEEIAALSPYELCLLMKTGAEMEKGARDIDPEQAGFPPNLPPPQFTIQIIVPSNEETHATVRLADGRTGWIPRKNLEWFQRENPDALVLH